MDEGKEWRDVERLIILSRGRSRVLNMGRSGAKEQRNRRENEG